jgi:high-affinity iron transporter
MLASYLLTLREGFEIALIIGIVLSILKKLDRTDLNRYVWIGASAAAFVCVLLGVGLYQAGISMEGIAGTLFEGISILLAAALLTWMIFWTQRQSAGLAKRLEQRIHTQTGDTAHSSAGPMIWLAFLTVLREGLELVLFLLATAFVATQPGARIALAGAGLGLATAVFLGWLLFNTTHQFSVKAFFRFTNLVLIVFAAGLVAHGVHELNEAGLIPALIDPIYNLNSVLNDQSFLGSLLSSLFGYNSSPSLAEVLAYCLYFGIMLFSLSGIGNRSSRISSGPSA